VVASASSHQKACRRILDRNNVNNLNLSAVSVWLVIEILTSSKQNYCWLLFVDNVVETGRRLQSSVEQSVSKLVDVDALESLVLVTEVISRACS